MTASARLPPHPADLSVRARAAQLVFVRLGSNMPPPVTIDEDEARVAALLAQEAIGGLVLFNAAWPSVRGILSRLQAQSRWPLLVGTDMERGVGQQVQGASVFPHALAFSALGDDAEALTERYARIAAREALACGIHLAFAPVADVNRNRQNPIIATRAFGTDAETVSRLVRAYLHGCQQEGLLTTAKHFPGHGATSQDSHAELPAVGDARAVLETHDLPPFHAAIEAGVSAIMTAHVTYPALDDSGNPATLSRPILHHLLRGEMGFEGPVLTDSLLMGAVRTADPGAQAVALVQAGVDVLLDTQEPAAVIDALVEAVADGRLSEARLDEAVRRVWRLKRQMQARFGDAVFGDPAQVFADVAVGSEAHQHVAAEIARRAVTVLDAQPGMLPLRPTGSVHAWLVKPFRSRFDPPEEPFGAALKALLPAATYRQIEPDVEDWSPFLAPLRPDDTLIVALVAKPAAWHRFGLQPHQQEMLAQVVKQRPTILLSLGSPYVLDDFPEAAARLCTFSDVAVAQQAGARFLLEGKK